MSSEPKRLSADLVKLATTLKSRRDWSISELAEELNWSEVRVQAGIDQLQAEGIAAQGSPTGVTFPFDINSVPPEHLEEVKKVVERLKCEGLLVVDEVTGLVHAAERCPCAACSEKRMASGELPDGIPDAAKLLINMLKNPNKGLDNPEQFDKLLTELLDDLMPAPMMYDTLKEFSTDPKKALATARRVSGAVGAPIEEVLLSMFCGLADWALNNMELKKK